ncbi:hypothetical protein KSS87_004519 [Heliosperma pusillum]|nr:hypothetical protein KSS87_004519 [Heliosperma pusillum]
MKTSQDSQTTTEKQSANQVSHESQSDQQNHNNPEAVPDSGSAAVSSNDGRKISREDIELVQNLIERCLQLYMNRDEVVKTLLNRARIDPGFTTLGRNCKHWNCMLGASSSTAIVPNFDPSLIYFSVWQKLEEENADFFRAYYIRLKLKKQIVLFNHLLEHQYHLMKYPVPPKVPLAPIQNGIHPMPVNNLSMGYPVLQPPPVPATGQPHLDSMSHGLSGCHVVNGVPAPSNYQPMRMNSGNDILMESSSSDPAPVIPPSSGMSSMSEMPISPTSVASSGHFPFTASEISGMGVDTSALDTAFQTDVGTSIGLPDGGAGHSKDSLRSLAQIPWNFSLSDLTADLSNLGVLSAFLAFSVVHWHILRTSDILHAVTHTVELIFLFIPSAVYADSVFTFSSDLGPLGNYPGSPFLHSDSDILLDSPENDDLVEEFFVDHIPGPPQSDEEKP